MAVYGFLAEGFISDKIKAAVKKNKEMVEAKKKEREKAYAEFYKDESGAIKDVKEQIKKVAPQVVASYNKNGDAMKTLNKAIDLLDCAALRDRPVRKFVYKLGEEDDDHITIVVLDKSVSDAVDLVGEIAFRESDNPWMTFEDEITVPLYDIFKDIDKKVSSDTVKLVNDFNDILDDSSEGQITFWFEPKHKR